MRPTLYKYFPISSEGHLERLEKILQGWIYFSSPGRFNDPFEMSPLLVPPKRDDVEEIVASFGDEVQQLLSKSALEKMFRQITEGIRVQHEPAVSREWLESIGVLCLTSNSNDLLMWAHYAGNHSGVCIGFDSACRPFNAAREIKYREARPGVSAIDLHRSEDDFIEQVLFTKSPHWQYEAEWRCIKRPLREEELRYYRELSESDPVRSNEIADLLATEGGAGQYEFQPEAIRRVYIGARVEPTYRQRIFDLLQRYKLSPRLFQMTLDPRYFRLNPEKVRRQD